MAGADTKTGADARKAGADAKAPTSAHFSPKNIPKLPFLAEEAQMNFLFFIFFW
jgi:hypothetical protein